MSTNSVMCECGRGPIEHKKYAECSRCYHSRWKREHYVPKPVTPGDLSTAPCSYGHAHVKLRRYRGVARDYPCQTGCGRQAQEWSYRGGSKFEQSALRIQTNKGVRVESHTTWSPWIWDYDALCRPCHLDRDGRIS